jgi:hypothetical protein
MKGLPPEDTRIKPKFRYRIGVNGKSWIIKTTTLDVANRTAEQLFDGGAFNSVEIYDTKGHVLNVIRKD